MSGPDEERRASQTSVMRVFDGLNLKWHEVNNADDLKALFGGARFQMVEDYLYAGISYFSSHKDPYLREVGDAAKKTLSQGRVGVCFTSNIAQAAHQWGVPVDMADKVSDDIVFYSVVRGESNQSSQSAAAIFISGEFITQAKKDPLLALSKMIRIFSGVRDFVNARLGIEGKKSVDRANASIAHFLNAVAEDDPGLIKHQLYQDKEELLNKFPEGIDSLRGGRYSTLGLAGHWQN